MKHIMIRIPIVRIVMVGLIATTLCSATTKQPLTSMTSGFRLLRATFVKIYDRVYGIAVRRSLRNYLEKYHTRCDLSAESTMENIMKLTYDTSLHNRPYEIVHGHWRKLPSAHKENQLSTPTEFWGEFGAFANSPLAQQLFEPSKKEEHLLFYVNACYWAHVFVIEKKCDGKNTWWKIYQSWEGNYNLEQWLGSPKHAWPLLLQWTNYIPFYTEFHTELRNAYGKSKQLKDPIDIQNFIKKIVDYIVPFIPKNYRMDSTRLPFYIRVLTVPDQQYQL